MGYEQFADGSGIFAIMAKVGCHGHPSLIDKINIKNLTHQPGEMWDKFFDNGILVAGLLLNGFSFFNVSITAFLYSWFLCFYLISY